MDSQGSFSEFLHTFCFNKRYCKISNRNYNSTHKLFDENQKLYEFYATKLQKKKKKFSLKLIIIENCRTFFKFILPREIEGATVTMASLFILSFLGLKSFLN